MLSPTNIRIWYVVHRWTSLVCTVFMLLLCVTGLPLIFHDEIDDWIGDGLSVPAVPAGTTTASLDRVVAAAQQRYPHEFVQFFVWDRERPELIKVTMAPIVNAPREQFHRLVIDARTTAVLAEPKLETTFTKFMPELHAEMFMGLPGGLFLGAMGLLLVAAIVSGVVLYARSCASSGSARCARTGRRGSNGSICTICSESSPWPGRWSWARPGRSIR
jgi:uncharacterized iron-regulated membrane protein